MATAWVGTACNIHQSKGLGYIGLQIHVPRLLLMFPPRPHAVIFCTWCVLLRILTRDKIMSIRSLSTKICASIARRALPRIVRERLVGVRHLVRVFALGHRGAFLLEGIHQFVGHPQRHRLTFLTTRSLQNP